MSLVFDARRHAERSKRAREAIAAISEAPGSGPPSSDPQDDEFSRQISRSEPTPGDQIARVTPEVAIAKECAEADQRAIVRSLLRAARVPRKTSTSAEQACVAPNGQIEPAALISRTEPAYPSHAKDSQIAGKVEIHFRISPEGKVYDAKLVRGPEILARAAIEAVQAWSYQPARLYGAPIDSQGSFDFEFKLN